MLQSALQPTHTHGFGMTADAANNKPMIPIVPRRGISLLYWKGYAVRVRKGEYSTFGVWGGPRYDAPHQAAVEQNFLGEAVVPAEMLQVFPPLGSLGRCAHGWNFSSIAKHQSSTSTTKRICAMCDFEAPKVVFFFHWEKKKTVKATWSFMQSPRAEANFGC